MEFFACAVFIGLMFLWSSLDQVKTAASCFWLVILFIGFITSPNDKTDTTH
jgi:hypothetical protein